MEDEFSNFSKGITEELEKYFLYELHNQKENELLAAVYLQAVNVTDELYEKSRQKHRSKQTEICKPIKNYNKDGELETPKKILKGLSVVLTISFIVLKMVI